MGERGPVPKRSAQRRRQNKPAAGDGISSSPAGARGAVPPADPDWHPLARDWYVALAESGQSFWYEASDWATARLLAESMSRDLKPQVVGVTDEDGPITREVPVRGASLAAYLKAMASLLVTEGDRRRVRVELERGGTVDPDEEAAVARLDEYRARITP